MKKRQKMPAKRSKRLFTHTANRTHVKNIMDRPMRGGIRL